MSRSLFALMIAAALLGSTGIVTAQDDQPGSSGKAATTPPPPGPAPTGPAPTAPPADSKMSPPEKVAPPIKPSDTPKAGTTSGPASGTVQKGGVITPPATPDPGMQKTPPDTGPNSMPVIKPAPNSETAPK